MSKQVINKASVVKNPNKYIWIRKQKSGNITDKGVKLEIHDDSRGIAYYYKDDKANILVWRFEKSKNWTEDTARVFALAFGSGTAKSLQDAEEVVKSINEWDGLEETYLSHELREELFKFITPLYSNSGVETPKLETQIIYRTAKFMKDKMKLLVELSNQKFHEFIEQAQGERPDIVKSALKDKVEEKGFKFFGTVEAFKIIEKAKDGGKDKERWRMKTVFTSNKGDLHWDVTSKSAIEKAVSDLAGKVIPIRFEHGTEDFGVWDTFKTEERDGILYGIAEGEIYQQYNRSQDLWHDIYELGKEFATSYGGRWIEFHWYAKEDTGEVLRVFDEIVIEEISLTVRPANPDTAVEVLNKYAVQLENTLDNNVLTDIISKSKVTMNKKDELKKQEGTEQEDATVTQPAEGTEQAPTEQQEETTTPAGEEVKPTEGESSEESDGDSAKEEETPAEGTETAEEDKQEDEQEATEEEKSKGVDATEIAKTLDKVKKSLETVDTIAKAFSDVAAELDSISKRLSAVENQPEKPATVAKTDGEAGDDAADKAQEELEKAFPFSTMIAKKYGRI